MNTFLRLGALLALPGLALACEPGLKQQNQPDPVTPSTRAPQSFVRDVLIERARAERPTLARERPTITPERRVGQLPTSVAGPFFSGGSAFTFPSGTAPGSGSYTQAPVIDPNSSSVPSVGGGSIAVTVNGVSYNAPITESVSYVMSDPGYPDSLVLTSWAIEIDPITGVELASVLHIVAPLADFAVGASVALDGADRIAVFAHGDIAQPEPELWAVAVTGQIDYLAGATGLGSLIDATVSGDFGEIQVSSNPPPPPPPPPGAIAAGNWQLGYGTSAFVYCDGTLIGQESAFSGITGAQIGFVDGPIAIAAPSTTELELSGTPISTAFTTPTLMVVADANAPPGTYVGFASIFGTGPLGTDLMGVYLLLDATSATPTQVYGQAGAGYGTPDGMGWCQVDFEVQLTP